MKAKRIGNIITALSLTVSMLAAGAVPALAEDQSVVSDVELTAESGTESQAVSGAESEEAESSISESIAEEAVKMAVTEGKYLKELRVASADSEDKAKSLLTESGYTVIDQNVNKDADVLMSSKKAVYIGYTTTDNITEAVRDVSLMNTNGGYVITDFQTAVNDLLPDLAITEEDHIAMIQDYRSKYNAGSPAAKMAYQELNRFIEDDSGKLLGDYLLDVDLTPTTKDHISDFMNFYMTISKSMLGIVDTWLAFSTASYGDATFPARIANMSADDIESAKADRVNLSHAETLLPYLQSYSETLNDAANMIDEMGVDSEQLLKDSDAELTTEEATMAVFDLYLDHLENFAYGDETFADLLLNDELTADDLTLLASQMSDAQIAAVKNVGFDLVMRSEMLDANTWNQYDDMNELQKEISKKIDEVVAQVCEKSSAYRDQLEEGKPLSVYYGIDRSILEGTVAVTSSAIRQMQATSDYSALTGSDDETDLYGLLVMGVGGAISAGLLAGGAYIIRSEWDRYKQETINNIIGDWDLEGEGKFVHTAELNSAKIAAGRVLIGASFAVVIMVMSGFYLWKEYKSKHKTFDKELIPDVMLDLRTNENGVPYYVRYTSVKEFTKTNDELDPGDVNGYVGDQWNVLYTTTDVDGGDPLQAAFRVSLGSASKSSNEIGIHTFGSTEELNLNSYTYNESSAEKIYLYTKAGIITGLVGSIFSGTSGYVVFLILGVLLGAVLMTVLHLISARRKNV